MRIKTSSGASTHALFASGGAMPSSPLPSGWWQAAQATW
jgi:hypothetical protein